MDDERRQRLLAAGCQLAAVVLVAVMIAGQYRAVVLPPHPVQLPVTGSEDAPKEQLGFWEGLRLKAALRDRYRQLKEAKGLTAEQQQQLTLIAEQLGL